MLGTLGDLLARKGRFAEARAALAAGHALLREMAAEPALVTLLCDRARVEKLAGDDVAAGDAIAAAMRALEASGLGAESEVGRRAVALRDQLKPVTGIAAP